MTIDVSFKHMDSSDSTRAYILEKCERLTKYFNGRVHLTWTISIERQNRVAHCHLVGNNMDYFAEEATDDMHGSVDLCVEKIERQLRKHKEIVKDHLHRAASGE